MYGRAYRVARFLVLYHKYKIVKTPVDLYVINAIRKERIAQKVSQAMLAYGIGVSKGFIGMAESPKYNIKYNIHHINEIARFLGCSPRDFLPEKPL